MFGRFYGAEEEYLTTEGTEDTEIRGEEGRTLMVKLWWRRQSCRWGVWVVVLCWE
jgi:hypothetical protein